MRLGQLARKLSLKPGELAAFLEKNGVAIEGGSNLRLDDDQVKWIVESLAPERLNEVLVEVDSEPQQVAQDEQQLINAQAKEPEIIESHSNDVVSEETQENVTEGPAQEIEVIRAPKVELPGLRVVGKIDLPEPKKKETLVETTAEASEAESQPQSDRRRRDNRRGDQYRKSPRKNPVVAQREREERESRKQKAIEAEQLKKQRTENYKKKFSTGDVKPSKKKAKKVSNTLPTAEQVPKEIPPTIVGKFRKWLFRE